MSKFPSYKKAKTGDLIPDAHNANQHTDEQIQLIGESILEFGFMNPIIVDETGKVLAGHGRLLAAQNVGLVEVPVLEARHLTAAQKRAYLLADNQIARNAYWDHELLRVEISALQEADFNLALTGFDDTAIEALLGDEPELPEPMNDDEDVISHHITCPHCGATFAKDSAR